MSQVEEVAEHPSGSLAGRMAARRKELQEVRAEVFPFPGWESMLAVEMQVLGYEALSRIGERHKTVRLKWQRELYIGVDILIAATTGFYEVAPDGSRKRISDSWIDLARTAFPDSPEDMTTRQAFFVLLPEKETLRIGDWLEEWKEWATVERQEVDEEVARDFGGTP